MTDGSDNLQRKPNPCANLGTVMGKSNITRPKGAFARTLKDTAFLFLSQGDVIISPLTFP